jgi:hypothetical protein
MQSEVWKALLRRVPPEQGDNLMLMTAQGTEINVQVVLQLDEDFVVVRGRIAGSNDGGRVFFLPYEHLDHIGFQRPVSDALLQAAFGITPPPAVETPNAAPTPEQEPAAPAPEVAEPVRRAQAQSRSKIIQRLRQRALARDGGTSPAEQ